MEKEECSSHLATEWRMDKNSFINTHHVIIRTQRSTEKGAASPFSYKISTTNINLGSKICFLFLFFF